MTNRARNLAAFLAVGGTLACAHALAAEPLGRAVPGEAFAGRFLEANHPMPGSPAILVLGGTLAPEVATAAASAGIAALVVEGGEVGQALLWLGPRAKRIFVATDRAHTRAAAELAQSGHVAGLVLLEPPAPPSESNLPCLVLDGGAPGSRQSGKVWELTLPELKPGATVSPEARHTATEAIALWLRARAQEP